MDGLERLAEALRRSTAVAAWSLFVSESYGQRLGIKDGETGNAHAPLSLVEACGAHYLLVWDDGRISRGFLERRQLADSPEATLARARTAAYSDPDAAQVRGPVTLPDVQLYDPAAAAAARGDVSALAARLAVVRAYVSEQGVRTWSGSFSATESWARIVTSRGLDANGRGTSTGWFVNFEGEIGTGFAARRAEPDADFAARLDGLAGLLRELRRDAPRLPGAIRPVILHPRVVEGYVLHTLLHHLEGATVFHDEGQFRRQQFGDGRPVMREDLSLVLDPLQPLRSGSYRFTAEGVPAARYAFIERGRLVSPLLNLKYARRLGRAPSPLPYAMDVVELAGPPALELEHSLAQADGGALVPSVLGAHTQDSASGDFSLAAPQTLAIGGAELRGRMRATLSGNLFELLRDDGLRLVRFAGEHTPGLLVGCRLDPA